MVALRIRELFPCTRGGVGERAKVLVREAENQVIQSGILGGVKVGADQ